MRTVEATIDEKGQIHFAEPVELSHPQRVLVTLLDAEPPKKHLRPYGLAAGDFAVPADFDAPVHDD